MLICLLLGGALLITGLILALKLLKPIDINWLAGIIIVIGTVFGLFGKRLYELAASKKSDRLLTTTQNTYDQVTGGESYCLLEVTIEKISKNPMCFLRHVGNNSLTNIQLSIDDQARRACLMHNFLQKNPNLMIPSTIINATNYNYSHD
jgi:hypothetical protein